MTGSIQRLGLDNVENALLGSAASFEGEGGSRENHRDRDRRRRWGRSDMSGARLTRRSLFAGAAAIGLGASAAIATTGPPFGRG